jgi:3-hydroxyacyl-[acyl-carrier-protein] dehydratase
MDNIQSAGNKRGISLSAVTTARALPHAYPFVLLDRVKACYPEEGTSLSIKNITMTDPVLSGHFPGHPIYPGVLIIEAMNQNACMIIAIRDLLHHLGSYEALLDHLAKPVDVSGYVARHFFLAESKVKNTYPIYPGDTVEIEAKLILERDGAMVFKVGASVDGKETARGQLTMVNALATAVVDKVIDR